MDSMPPATTHCSSPALIAWAASITALRPEPQTLLTVSEGIVPGRPAWIAAWRAGAWPSPPWSTLPRMTSSTRAASTPARRTASLITIAPRRGAGSRDRPPRYLPTGVRTALTMTGVFASDIGPCFKLMDSRRGCDSRPAGASRTPRVARPPASCPIPAPARRPSRLRPPVGRRRPCRHLVGFGVADLVVQRLVTLIQVRAQSCGAQLRLNLPRGGKLIVADRQHAHLLRREPQRECTGEVLDQKAHEPLQRAEDRAVDHDGSMRPVVLARVLESEALGLLEIQLDRRPLPLAPDGVVELDVDLRSVERASALVDAVGGAAVLERLLERAFRLVPRRVGAQLLVGPRGEVEPIGKAEGLPEHQLHEIEQLEDLLLDLVLAQEDVRVVHGEPAHAQHPVQRPRALVAVQIGDLGEADRQVAVAALLRGVDEDVHRAVHRLDPIAHGFRLALPRGHGRELVRRVQREVPRAQEQLLAGDVGRVDQRVAALEDRVLDEAPQLKQIGRASCRERV